MNISTGTTMEEDKATITLLIKDLLLPAWLPLSFPSSSARSVVEESPLWRDLSERLAPLSRDPTTLFHTLLVSLVSLTVFVRILQFQLQSKSKKKKMDDSNANTQPAPLRRRLSLTQRNPNLRTLQWKFLSVFWLLRTSFWMSGPYFYAAYASKTNGDAALISKISLTGYAAIALLGPYLGKLTDKYGRKTGTIAAATLYGLGSLSVMANGLWSLFLGRALGGVGTSLLSAAPEAWLVSALNHASGENNPVFLQQTFGMAYAYDSVCAIAAGQIAGFAAGKAGPTGPFRASPIFLAVGAILAAVFWEENRAGGEVTSSNSSTGKDNGGETTDDDSTSTSSSESNNNNNNSPPPQSTSTSTIWDALKVIRSDHKILLLGGVQAFFEGAMYIFVMQWPPTLNRAIQMAFGKRSVTPYGTAFSCFMACCMAGSTVFGILAKRNKSRGSNLSFEKQTVAMVGCSCLAMIAATSAVSQGDKSELWQLIAAYFAFEACVGMYFPSIGTLRSKYLPNSHRSLIMTLFGVPLNIIVVTVFLLVHKLGEVGALAIAAVALGLATACMMGLYLAEKRERRKKHVRDRFKQVVRKVQVMRNLSEVRRERLLREATHERRASYSGFCGPQFF